MAGTVEGRLTEIVPVINPSGSIGRKTVKRINPETGIKEITTIPKEENTNPEVKYKKGGRPDSGKQGSVNSELAYAEGEKNNFGVNIVNQEGTKKIIDAYNNEQEGVEVSEEGIKEQNKDQDESHPATQNKEIRETEDEANKRRQALVRGTYRKERNADGSIKKSWEVWLTKYTETDSDKELSIELDTARQIGLKKIPKRRTKPTEGVDAKKDEISLISTEKWKSWLEKMQGAGDARFGNQHLTGLDQKPVNNEEDEANILPEKDEKTDEKEEKEEETDEKEGNKPYKGLMDG
jgi:hypothetical protein